MKKFVSVFAVLMLLVLAGCSGDDGSNGKDGVDGNDAVLPVEEVPVATITGTVLNTKGAGIMGATVAVEGQNITASTAIDGSFSLTGLTPGFIYLDVTSPSDAYLDGGNRSAINAPGNQTVAGVQVTLSGRPSANATYLGSAKCNACHQAFHPGIVEAFDASPQAAIHSRFITEGTSHLVYKNLWPVPGAKLVPKTPNNSLLKVQDPITGKGGASDPQNRVNVVLCRESAPPTDARYTKVGDGEQFLFKFYPYTTATLTEADLDCSTATAGATWIPIAATIGGEGNWGEGYADPEHVLPDRHPNFGEGKQRYMCRLEDVPYIKQWNIDHGVDRSGEKQDYVAYMPVFVMQDGTAAGVGSVLAPGEVGFPNFWQKSPEAWCPPYNSLSRNCAGCHATGLQLEMQDITYTPAGATTPVTYKQIVTSWDYKDLNVTCERCHGPGSEHFSSAGVDVTKLIMPQYLTTKAASETCGQCHGNHDGRSITPAGVFKPAYDGNYKNTLGNGSFVPGIYSLETFFTKFNIPMTIALEPGKVPVDNWQSGSFVAWPDQVHARVHSQELLELTRSVHYNNPYEKLVCFDCHDAHTLDGGPAVQKVGDYTFANVTYANNTLCLTCHAAHGPFADVSTANVAVLQLDAGRAVTMNGTAVTITASDKALARDRVAKAVAEHMQEKAGMGGALYTPTDPDLPTGSCTSCHMAKIGRQQDINVDAMYHLAPDSNGRSAVAEGNVASHIFDIVWPGQSAVLKNPDPSKGRDFDIMPNSCSKCHEFARISGDLD